MSCTTAAALLYGTAVQPYEYYAVHSSSTVRLYEYESLVAAVLGLYSSAVLNSCTRAPAAELYESCSTAVLVLVQVGRRKKHLDLVIENYWV